MILVQHKQWGKGSVYRKQLAGTEGEQKACRIFGTNRRNCEWCVNIKLTLHVGKFTLFMRII